MFQVDKRLRPLRGSRVVQIPLVWPARYGTVLEVKAGVPPAEVLIGWDDGRQDWIEDEELRASRIWLIAHEPVHELKAGPLEVQLAGFMKGDRA
jgi:hypothetical protein